MWVNWISLCIPSVWFSIPVNSMPVGSFAAQKDLCLGDPVSHFLFI